VTTLANDHIITTTEDNDENKAIEFDSEMELELETEDTVSHGGDVDANIVTESGYEKGNFFNRRRCQMSDDWGPIGLNCTDEDIVTERVEVVGFLANWLNTYLYIRSEFPLPTSHFPLATFPHFFSTCSTPCAVFPAGMSLGSFSKGFHV